MNVPFFIAKRYLTGKKGTQSVNLIIYISISAIAGATMAMFVILSAFSGLEKLNISTITNVYPEMKITAAHGKTLPNINDVEQILKKNTSIKAYSKCIEEKVYVSYRERQEIAYLKAVDTTYNAVFHIDSTIIAGDSLSYEYENEAIFGYTIATHINVPIGGEETAKLMVPKPGKGTIKRMEDAFQEKEVFVEGVFQLQNEKLNSYIITPLELGQDLLSLPNNAAYSIEISLKPNTDRHAIKKELQSTLNNIYIVQTREEIDASFLRMMNLEKLIIYLICTLIIIIITFNLASAIVILILDKKIQTKSLLSIGETPQNIKKIFFNTGAIIVFVGLFVGLSLGTIVVLSQLFFGWYRITSTMPFPMSLRFINYLITIATMLLFGLSVSYLASRKIGFEK